MRQSPRIHGGVLVKTPAQDAGTNVLRDASYLSGFRSVRRHLLSKRAFLRCGDSVAFLFVRRSSHTESGDPHLLQAPAAGHLASLGISANDYCHTI